MRHPLIRFLILLTWSVVPSHALSQDEPAPRPNIIYIMLDDAGWGDFGPYGSDHIQTPAMDRLAREGIRFTQHYAGAPVCAPTRAVLMTGLHTGHARRRDNVAKAHLEDFGEERPLVFLEPEDLTVAEVLKEAGYVTAGIGKWGLGNPGTTGEPTRQGFDHWFGYLDQVHAHDQYPDWLWKDGQRVELPANANDAEGTYAHDLFEEETLTFVRANQSRPFFLYLAYTLPHRHYSIPADDPALALYRDKPWPEVGRIRSAMITRADQTVERLLSLLEELNLEDDTIVFYTSDNGPNLQFVPYLDSNGPFRGGKQELYEGGIRSPMVVRWPGQVPAGRSSDVVWDMRDFFPTVADLIGVEAPEHLDGISVLPALRGAPDVLHEALYWETHTPFQQAVRLSNWKGMRFGTDEPLELYDLSRDLGEEKDVSAEHPDVAARIIEIMDTSRTESRYWPAQAHRR